MLLVNKADLVSEEQRKEWAKYFNEKNIDFVFFSAVEEQERLEDEAEKEDDESDLEEEKGILKIFFNRKKFKNYVPKKEISMSHFKILFFNLKMGLV